MKPILLLTLFLGGLSFACPAQTRSQQEETSTSGHVYYDKITAIYGADRVQNDPDLVENLVILLRDRIAYQFEAETPGEKYPKIASFPLMNKVNTGLAVHDPSTFDVTTFNPLMYRWNFFSDRTLVFRIDGTPYILIVEPQIIQDK